MNCYIVFTNSRHGHHAHVIVTEDPLFEIPEERFDQLGPLLFEPAVGDAEICERIADEMSHWLAQPSNAGYLEKSARPVAVFYDARALAPLVPPIFPRLLWAC